MYKIAITSLMAIAAVSAIDAATSDTIAATELGYPPYVNRQCDDAKGIKCLKAWQDRIYIGYGSWSQNRGPVCINYYSPTDTKFVTETVYVDSENQNEIFLLEDSIDHYAVIWKKLYITGTDPMPNPNETKDQSWEWGNFYRNDGDGWIKYRTIPNGVHNFDMIKKDGDLFAAIGIGSEGVPLLRSADNGQNWVDAIGSSSIKRFNHLFKINDALYAITSKGDPGKVYKYDNATQLFIETSWNLMPGDPGAVACIATTDERIYYIKKGHNKVYTALPEEDGVELTKHNPDEKIWDLKTKDQLLYMLATVEDGDNYKAGICKVVGTKNKGNVYTTLPSEAISMEILNGTIYLGTKSGIIYSIPDNT
jgi:hypothetical protein